jgi:site-specific recombinase XerD
MPSNPSRRRPSGPDLAELAEDWLAVKRVGNRPDDPGNSDRARRADLVRWAGAFNTVLGHNDGEDPIGLAGWSLVTATELASSDLTVAALGWLADQQLAVSTRQRMLATLRGWCAWLTRRGHLTTDPTDADEVRLRSTDRDLDGKTFTVEEVDFLLDAASRAPADNQRSYWPVRDVAVVSVLAFCGLRVSELCNLTTASYVCDVERPVFKVRGSKGGKGRVVPIPMRTTQAIDVYLRERAEEAGPSPALAVRPRGRLFISNDARPLSQQQLDRQLRQFCARSEVDLPDGAMAHALRHFYGSQLAVRGVPLPIIQQLMGHTNPATTTIYTRATANDTTGVLDDAGWL